jgi:hypothetical protein
MSTLERARRRAEPQKFFTKNTASLSGVNRLADSKPKK